MRRLVFIYRVKFSHVHLEAKKLAEQKRVYIDEQDRAQYERGLLYRQEGERLIALDNPYAHGVAVEIASRLSGPRDSAGTEKATDWQLIIHSIEYIGETVFPEDGVI